MQKRVLRLAEEFARRNRKWHIWQRIVAGLACAAVFCTTYALILPAITMEGESFCGIEEHTHDESCYAVPEEGGEPQLVCGKQEHSHSLACYSNPDADVETPDVWAASVPAPGGSAAQNLLNAAQSQLGYTESVRNYQVAEGGQMYGYSRYGAWAGAPYSPWDLHFVRFCMSYAGVPQNFAAGSEAVSSWAVSLQQQGLYSDGSAVLPMPGEVVFLNLGGTITAGVVSSVSDAVGITAIVGDYNNQVCTVTLASGSPELVGVMLLAEHPAPQEPEPPAEPAPEADSDSAAASDSSGASGSDSAAASDSSSASGSDSAAASDSSSASGSDSAAASDSSSASGSDSAAASDSSSASGSDSAAASDSSNTSESDSIVSDPDSFAEIPIPEDGFGAWAQLVGGSASGEEAAAQTEAAPAAVQTMASPMLLQAPRASNGPKAVGKPVDMTHMVTKVTMEKKVNGAWTPVKDTVEVGEAIRLSMQYVVPGNTLSAQNNQILYNVPETLKISKGSTGDVLNGDNVAVGVYEITTDNKILITFDKNYAKENENGKTISGAVSFDATINDIKAKPGEDVTIQFNDKINVTVKVEPNRDTLGDVLVTKKAVLHPAAHEVEYTIVVSSVNGTHGPVTITDTMTKGMLSYGGSLSAVDKKGKPVEITGSPTTGSDKFEIKLPQMAKGEEYTLTYRAAIKEGVLDGQLKNQVKASSVNSENTPISSSTEVTSLLRMVEKTARVNKDGTVDWTITINRAHQNIGGWTLRDVLRNNETGAGTELKKQVTIKPAGGKASQVTLPYKFPKGSTDEYTITYKTTQADHGDLLPGDKGRPNLWNEAILELDKQKYTSGKTPVGVPYNPVGKGGRYTDNMDGTLTVHWTVTIQPEFGPIPTGTWLSDRLRSKGSGVQYFTAQQLTAARDAMENELKAKGVACSASGYWANGAKDWKPWPTKGELPAGKYQGFRVKLADPLPRNQTVAVNYDSTAEVTAGTAEKFYNRFTILGEFDDGRVDYKPDGVFVEKYDPAKGPDGGNSSHLLHNLTNGELKWTVRVTLPPLQSGDTAPAYTMVDTLPDGVTLTRLAMHTPVVSGQTPEFQFNGTDEAAATLKSGKKTGTCTAVKSQNGKVITLNLDQELVGIIGNAQVGKANYCYFEITVKIDPDFQWPLIDGDKMIYQKDFANGFSVKNPDKPEEEIAWGGHTHQVTKYESAGSISKKGTNSGSDNRLIYTLEINPEGKDLLAGSDTLTVIDTLSYLSNPNSGNPIRVEPVPGSLQMYRRNSDGSRGEKLAVPPYTYKESNVSNRPDDPAGMKRWDYELKITVPDAQALIIEYVYNVSGEIGQKVNMDNTAKIEGYTQSETEGEKKMEIVVKKASATAEIKGVTLRKTELGHDGIVVPGAKFKLYRWVSPEEGYVGVTAKNGSDIFTTDENGRFNVGPDTVDQQFLVHNTGYKLVEIEAPEGYLVNPTPLLFYVFHQDESKYPLNLPEGMTQNDRVFDGSSMLFRDEKNATEIGVVKNWKNMDGEPVTKTDGSIEVELWRRLENTPASDEKIKTMTLDALNGWKATEKNLLSAKKNADGSSERYFYYVREITVPGYTVTYTNNDGINAGTITVTNREIPAYELPQTGGSGTAPLRMIASVLCIGSASVLLLRCFRRRKAERRG